MRIEVTDALISGTFATDLSHLVKLADMCQHAEKTIRNALVIARFPDTFLAQKMREGFRDSCLYGGNMPCSPECCSARATLAASPFKCHSCKDGCSPVCCALRAGKADKVETPDEWEEELRIDE